MDRGANFAFRDGGIVVYDSKTLFRPEDATKILHVNLSIVDDLADPIEIDYATLNSTGFPMTVEVKIARSANDYESPIKELRRSLETYVANVRQPNMDALQEIRLHSKDLNDEIIKGNSTIELVRTTLMRAFPTCKGVDFYINRRHDLQSVKNNPKGKHFSAPAQQRSSLEVVKVHQANLMIGAALFLVGILGFKVGQHYPVGK